MYVCKWLPQCWSSVCRKEEVIHQVQSITVLRPLNLSECVSSSVSGSKMGMQAGWKLSSRKEVRSLREQAKGKCSAEKDENTVPLDTVGAASYASQALHCQQAWFSTRLPGRRMWGLCALPVTSLLLLSLAGGWHPPWQRQPRVWCCAVHQRQLVSCVIVRLSCLWEEI